METKHIRSTKITHNFLTDEWILSWNESGEYHIDEVDTLNAVANWKAEEVTDESATWSFQHDFLCRLERKVSQAEKNLKILDALEIVLRSLAEATDEEKAVPDYLNTQGVRFKKDFIHYGLQILPSPKDYTDIWDPYLWALIELEQNDFVKALDVFGDLKDDFPRR